MKISSILPLPGCLLYTSDHDGTGPVMTVKKDSEAYSRNGLVRFTVPDDFDITQFNNITLDFFIASTNDSHSRTVLVYACLLYTSRCV